MEDHPETVRALRQTIESATATLQELLSSQEEAKVTIQYQFPASAGEAAFEAIKKISQFQASLSSEEGPSESRFVEIRKLLTPSMQSLPGEELGPLIESFVNADPINLRSHLSLPYFVEDLDKLDLLTSELCEEFIDMVSLPTFSEVFEDTE